MSHLLDVTPFFIPADHDDWGPPVRDAITQAKNTGLGGIYFPSGSYNFKAVSSALAAIEITDVDGFTVAGDGPTSRLFHDAATLAEHTRFLLRIANVANRVTVRDLMLDGSFTSAKTQATVTEQHHLIRIGFGSGNAPSETHTTHQVRVTNCYLKNCRGDGINILGETGATGALTFHENPIPGDEVTIGTIIYKFVTTVGAAFDVKIGAGKVESRDNLAKAIQRKDPAVEENQSYGNGTAAHVAIGQVHSDTFESNPRLTVRSRIAAPIALAPTLESGSQNGWDSATTIDRGLTDEVIIDHNYIYQTHRTGIGVQRGCRKVVIDSNLIVPANRGVIDFEPTGTNIDSEDWIHGNSPQQFIITNNVLVKPKRNNTAVSFSGTGSKDRNKHSIFSHNLCLGGGIEGQNVGPVIVDSNIFIGNRTAAGDGIALISFHRGCEDVIISNNYIERPVPEDGEAPMLYTLNLFHENDKEQIPHNPTHHETITVGTVTYRFRQSPTVLQANDVRIGLTSEDTCRNIKAALSAPGPEMGDAYGNDTASNPLVLLATSEERSVNVFGNSIEFPVAESLAFGNWKTTNRAGPFIRIFQSVVQPTRVNILNNIGRQHMAHSGIDLDSVNHVLVQGNQLHCFHSGESGDTGAGIIHKSTLPSDQIHIKGNHLMTHGTGRWESGIRLAGIEKLSQSSVTDNSIHGAATGISYVGNDTDTPKDIPTVAGNRISGQTIAAAKLPTPTCIGGNLGDIAQFTGAGKPNFVAPKGSTYINRDGIFGSDDPDKAPRYLSDGTMHWHPIANG